MRACRRSILPIERSQANPECGQYEQRSNYGIAPVRSSIERTLWRGARSVTIASSGARPTTGQVVVLGARLGQVLP